MPTLIARSTFGVDAATLFAWHERPGAFQRLAPPWQEIRLISQAGGIRDGGSVVFRSRVGPIPFTWHAEHKGFMPGRRFIDEQRRGPFAKWVHRHEVSAGPTPNTSVLTDTVEFALPMHSLTWRFAGAGLKRDLERLFAFRHARVRADLAMHAELAAWQGEPRWLRVGVSGSSGAIGSALCGVLSTAGHDVVRLVRRKAGVGEILWQPGAGAKGGQLAPDALDGLDAVVHLAGEPVVSGRWTKRKRDRIRSSRVDGTRLIANTIAASAKPPKVLVVASGVGLYGDRGDQELTEGAGVGSGFLAEVSRDWEAAAEPARVAGVRVVNLRIGVALARRSGLLRALVPWFQAGLGCVPGEGQAWWPWVDMDDVVAATLFALVKEEISGAINIVSPAAVRSADFARILAESVDRSLLAKVPAGMLQGLLGDKAEALLVSCRAVPEKLRRAGYRFIAPDLAQSLKRQLGIITPAEAGVEIQWS
ncbi:MAG: TIGR01777 family protein [Tepidisphaera sp.]|nr:TIGR01777 family protein [Tepidisphaera sp.]